MCTGLQYRAIPLFFAFDRTNYSRRTPLYYEDCLKLSEVFLEIHAEFSQGRLVVIQTLRVAMGFQWTKHWRRNITSQRRDLVVSSASQIEKKKQNSCPMEPYQARKAQFTKFLQDLCQLNDDREYSLHHEFSEATTRADEEAVEQITTFLQKGNTPLTYCGIRIY